MIPLLQKIASSLTGKNSQSQNNSRGAIPFMKAAMPTSLTNRLDNPTSAERVRGTLLTQHTADQGGYSPGFRNFAQYVLNPSVVSSKTLKSDYSMPQGGPGVGVGGDFGKTIKINENALDQPEILTHEATHGINHLLSTPSEVIKRFDALQKNLTPRERGLIRDQASNSNSISGANSRYSQADEGLAYGSAMALKNPKSKAAGTYKGAFRSKNPQSFATPTVFAAPITRDMIDKVLRQGDYKGYGKNFSDLVND